MASQIYNSFKKKMVDGSNISLSSDTIKVALCTSSYTPNIDTHDFFDDITNELSTASGYTAGGATLANKTLTIDTTNDLCYLDADDTTWTASGTLTWRYAIIYKSTGTASTSPLIGYIDFVTDRSVVSGETLYIQWNSAGILKIA